MALPLPAVSEVTMDQVPDPPLASGNGKYTELWERVTALKPGRAVCAAFEHERQGKAVRVKFRKLAKQAGQFLSSSHSADGLTWYFWIEKAR